jgi:ABC-2 type transport system permease protein
MWSLRILTSRLRPVTAASMLRVVIVAAVFALFLWGDYALFRRLFSATAQIEAATPFFALGLLRNLLAMVFLVAVIVLFSSAMTTAIGAFFTDLDLDIYHSAPRARTRIIIARWLKTLLQSAAVVYAFIAPLFLAFGLQYHVPLMFYPLALLNLALLLSIPVSIASMLMIQLVRWFPVRRVHQIVATIAIIVLTIAVVGFRMSRPERFFTEIDTDDVTRVLKTIELPAMDVYPGTAIADLMVNAGGGSLRPALPWKIWLPATALFAAFLVTSRATYFTAFVRARESMAPTALGSAGVTQLLDRLLERRSPQVRALIGKEVRVLVRDAAQWSQVFLMGALLFIYLYNIRMLPLAGDARAAVVAYANLAMAGFVVSAICLRFAYPSVSAEGKAFWLLRTAPISYRRFLLVKLVVFATPLVLLSVLLTTIANAMLGASALIWGVTLSASVIIAVTLVALGVGMGAVAPNFDAENPLQVGLSLGGFAYMAISLSYIGTVLFLMARPIVRYLFWRVTGARDEGGMISIFVPLVIGLTLSAALIVFPLVIAERRLARER